MANDLGFLTGAGGASRAYTPAARKSDGSLAAQTDTPIVELSAYGLGGLTAMVSPTNNGTPIGTPPSGKRGIRFYVPPGASLSFTIQPSQPNTVPPVIALSNPASNTVPLNWDEDLAGSQQIYVTAVSGAPLFRWY